MLVLVVEVFYYKRKKKISKIVNLAAGDRESSLNEAKLFTTKIHPFDFSFDKNSSILLGSGDFVPVGGNFKRKARFSPISIVRARE